jgi:peptidoglycan/LPS O-acetylase OafA/YrhL
MSSSFLSVIQKPEVPSLNGIRAAAALIVVLFHLGITWMHGNYGVTAFFVLSGFLITHLLLKEVEQSGSVCLRNFYIRRTLRIFPAFYVFAAVYVLMRILLKMPVFWPQTMASLTYTRDYYDALVHPSKLVMGHTWSLAIEEQFYLLWPFIFRRFSNRLAFLAKSLACLIIGVWVYRVVLSAIGVNQSYIYYAFDTRVDALALGCLTAVLAHCGYEFPWLTRYRYSGLGIIIGAAALNCSSKLSWHFNFNNLVTLTLLPPLCAAFIVHSISFSHHWSYWILNNRASNYLGVISYPIYLYHPMIGTAIHTNHPVLRFVLGIFVCIGIASVSYYMVEKPFLRFKSRFSAGTNRRTRLAQTQHAG